MGRGQTTSRFKMKTRKCICNISKWDNRHKKRRTCLRVCTRANKPLRLNRRVKCKEDEPPAKANVDIHNSFFSFFFLCLVSPIAAVRPCASLDYVAVVNGDSMVAITNGDVMAHKITANYVNAFAVLLTNFLRFSVILVVFGNSQPVIALTVINFVMKLVVHFYITCFCQNGLKTTVATVTRSRARVLSQMMNMYGIFILSIICKIKCLVNVGVATVYLYSMHASTTHIDSHNHVWFVCS